MKTTKRKTPLRKSTKTAPRDMAAEMDAVTAANRKALWTTYRDLQKRVDQALAKLRTHFKKGSSPRVIFQDKQNLLLLLGECNYMARTCAELESLQDNM